MKRFVITPPVWKYCSTSDTTGHEAFVSDVTCERCGATFELAMLGKEDPSHEPSAADIKGAAALVHRRCGRARA